MKTGRKIVRDDLRVFNSAVEASKDTYQSPAGITRVLRGEQRSSFGYRYVYASDLEERLEKIGTPQAYRLLAKLKEQGL